MLPPSGLSKLDCRARLSLEKSPSSGTCDSPAVDQEVPRWHRPPIPTLISQPPRLPGTSLSLSAPDSRSPLGQLLMTHQIPFFFFFFRRKKIALDVWFRSVPPSALEISIPRVLFTLTAFWRRRRVSAVHPGLAPLEAGAPSI